MNALERLAGSYQDQCDHARQELTLAEGQVRDHEARLGQPFAHETYLAELTALRDQLKAALASTAAPDPGANPSPSAQELAGRIQALKAAHTVEPSPQRHGGRGAVRAEVPVTARIRRRSGLPDVPPTANESESNPRAPLPPSAPSFSDPASIADEPSPLAAATPARSTRPEPESDHRERVLRDQRRKERQLSMF
jgi:hypothetical protein